MVWAMVDAALLLLQSFLWLLAAAERGHVPDWASTAAAREVTRKPIPNRVRTLNIQMDPQCWHRRDHSESPQGSYQWLSKQEILYMKQSLKASSGIRLKCWCTDSPLMKATEVTSPFLLKHFRCLLAFFSAPIFHLQTSITPLLSATAKNASQKVMR